MNLLVQNEKETQLLEVLIKMNQLHSTNSCEISSAKELWQGIKSEKFNKKQNNLICSMDKIIVLILKKDPKRPMLPRKSYLILKKSDRSS